MPKIYGQLMKCNGFTQSYLQASPDEATEYCWNKCFIYSPLNFYWADFQAGIDHTWDHRSITSFICDCFSLGPSAVHMFICSHHILAPGMVMRQLVLWCKIMKVDLLVPLESLVLNVILYTEFLTLLLCLEGLRLAKKRRKGKRLWDMQQ